MSSLITMAVYDTEENNRTWMTEATLESLADTVDFTKHTLMVSDNGSCEETLAVYERHRRIISHTEWNGENLGTAAALNKLWRFKQPFHRCVVKIDNDVVIHQAGWLDLMEIVFERMPKIGICGLKRRDLEEWPIRTYHNPSPWYQSSFHPVPHKMGEPWLIVEKCEHVMGTCQAYRGELVGDDTPFGYLWQPRKYGLDDSLAAWRMKMLGLDSVFLHSSIRMEQLGRDVVYMHEYVPIDHVDPGGTAFIKWKQQEAGKVIMSGDFDRIRREYKSGTRPIYYDGEFGGADN